MADRHAPLDEMTDVQCRSALRAIREVLWANGDPYHDWGTSAANRVARVFQELGLAPEEEPEALFDEEEG